MTLAIKELTMIAVWENVIVQVSNIQMQRDNTLDQQIATDKQHAKLEKERGGVIKCQSGLRIY